MRFESQKDLERETKAIKTFCAAYNLNFEKQSDWDVDFVVFNNEYKTHVEVKGRLRMIKDCFPLPLAIRKIYKLKEVAENPIVIWACFDGIVYAKLNDLIGEIKKGGRKPRQGSSNDIEIMAYYPKQESIKVLKYNP